MTPKSTTLSGFRSFPSPVEFHFPPDPGLFFITGENLDEPQLDGNGAGKSSLFEAIPYALFGKTSIGAKGPQVASWVEGSGVTRVGFSWEAGGSLTKVTRGYKPTAMLLEVDGGPPQTVEQETIDAHVGLTRDQFLATVLFSQFGEGFMDLRPSGQLAAFSAALDLEHWTGCAKRAAEKVSGYKDRSEAITIRRAKARGVFEVARQSYNNRADEADAWDATEDERLAQVQGRRKVVQKQIENLKERLALQEDTLAKARRRKNGASSRVLKLSRDYDAFLDERETRLKALEQEIDAALAGDIDRLKKLRQESAEFRDQSDTEIAALREQMKTEFLELDKVYEDISGRATAIRKKYNDATTAYEKWSGKLDLLRARKHAPRKLLAEARGDTPKCGTCERPLEGDLLVSVREQLKEQVREIGREEAEADKKANDALRVIGATEPVLVALTKQLKELVPQHDEEKSALQRDLQAAISRLHEHQAGLDRACDDLAVDLASGRRALEIKTLVPVQQQMTLEHDRLVRGLRKARKELDRKEAELAKVRMTCSQAELDLERAQDELSTLTPDRRENPHDAPLGDQEKVLDLAEADIKKLQREFNALEMRVSRNGYWVTGFPRLRLWLLQGAAMEFQTNLQNNLGPMGLDGWRVECRTTRELKTGTERPELTTLITKRGCVNPAPLKSFSGGEAQRLRNAGKAAFADMVRSRMVYAPKFEMWDEPTAHLSPGGCDDLMTWLRERSRIQGRQVWVIDHRTQYAGDIDGHMRFILQHGETKIETDL